jgi:hypothetical protein
MASVHQLGTHPDPSMTAPKHIVAVGSQIRGLQGQDSFFLEEIGSQHTGYLA